MTIANKVPETILSVSCGTMATLLRPYKSVFKLVGNEHTQYDVIYRIHAKWVAWSKQNADHKSWQDSWVAFVRSL